MSVGAEVNYGLGIENFEKAEACYMEVKMLVDSEVGSPCNVLLKKAEKALNYLMLARQFSSKADQDKIAQLEKEINSLIEELYKKEK